MSSLNPHKENTFTKRSRHKKIVLGHSRKRGGQKYDKGYKEYTGVEEEEG